MAIALQAGLLGIALGGLLVSWYFKYCYFLFDSIVRGFEEPPVLDIQALNPLGERRPVVQLAVLCFAGGLVWLVATYAGWAPAALLGVLIAGVLPASVAVLALEEHPFKALSPLHLARLIHGLGVLYLAVLGTIAVGAALAYEWWQWMPWLPLRLIGPLFLILSVVSMLAGAIYTRRDELGVEVWHSPERREERMRVEENKAIDRVVDLAWNQARLGAHAVASGILNDWLSSRDNRPEDYQLLCERLAGWRDTRHLFAVTTAYVERLLQLKRNGQVLDVVGARLKSFPQFRPGGAATTLTVARIAAQGGSPAIARALLADFSTRFPEDPRGEVASRLVQELDGGAR